jgi:hypothetical protein
MTQENESGGIKTKGKVLRVLGDYGFLSNEDMPGRDVYFKAQWFRGNPPLNEGDVVEYELKTYGDNLSASSLNRLETEGSPSPAAVPVPLGIPRSPHLFDWAYLGYLPTVLSELKGFALPEDWEFKNTPPNAERPFPILFSYLWHTFGRLAMEKKVVVNERARVAALNTGLVDPRYEAIYALFEPNDDPRAPWQLANFCNAGEGRDGQTLVRHFNPLPRTAHYFDSSIDLLYDTRSSKPELDWRHVIIERIERYPSEFVEDHWPPQFAHQDVSQMTPEARKEYYKSLGTAIEADNRIYRRIISRVKDAVDLSIKRVAWNYKTAIPTYYPRVRKLQLLLPLCLVTDERVDLALAVEKTPSGNYLGHTALPLDWAYKNARLVCRPDSDWLSPKNITAVEGEDEE